MKPNAFFREVDFFFLLFIMYKWSSFSGSTRCFEIFATRPNYKEIWVKLDIAAKIHFKKNLGPRASAELTSNCSIAFPNLIL